MCRHQSFLRRFLPAILLLTCLCKFSFENKLSAQTFAEKVAPRIINWQNNLNSALVQSRQLNKPVLLYFSAAWCPRCAEMDRQTFRDGRVATEMSKWIPVRIDIDQQKEVAAEYKANTVPAFFFIQPNGSKSTVPTGRRQPEPFLELIKLHRTTPPQPDLVQKTTASPPPESDGLAIMRSLTPEQRKQLETHRIIALDPLPPKPRPITPSNKP